MDARSPSFLRETNLELLRKFEGILHSPFNLSLEDSNSIKKSLAQESWYFIEMAPPLSLDVIRLIEFSVPWWSKVQLLNVARYLWTHGLKNLEPELLSRCAHFIRNLEEYATRDEIKSSLNIRAQEILTEKYPKEFVILVERYTLN